MNPLYKDKPAEDFKPARIRGTGDCEDSAYEILQCFRELIACRDPAMSKELMLLQAMAKNYTAFMFLGSAVATDAGSTGGGGKNASKPGEPAAPPVQAHMYVLALPNNYLIDVGGDAEAIKKCGGTIPSGSGAGDLSVLLIEGTGCVHPISTRGQFGKSIFYMTPKGKEYSDNAVRKERIKSVRRFIYSPGTTKNDHVVDEFYRLAVSGVAHESCMGMYAFFDANGRIGPLVSDILKKNVTDVVMKPIAGTARIGLLSEKASLNADWQKTRALQRLHEPVFPYYNRTAPLPEGNLVNRLNALPKLAPEHAKNYDVQFMVSAADVSSTQVGAFLDKLERDNKNGLIAGVDYRKQPLHNAGAYQIMIKLS